MSKCAAVIELGWIKKCFEGNSPCDIIKKVEKYQDFDCLIRNCSLEGTEEDQKELPKLLAFLEKYYDKSLSIKDIEELNIRLSIGAIKCHKIARTEEEIIELRNENI